ncbi:hypothetical protein DFQ04_1184 [Algoriphagus boseongensis]|uniref:Oligosaccharide repeat unit polymerase n=1 Tax=Algoriphagus boseongensis TaxID=1442587 RepID=A0A4R6TAW0_9BACT|nr:hypothetical protein [Algoriphagus boseongensis]TDQ19363.1 hypothetical protein DFQ04_1184 [Algoriphagus boseongensis]
MSNWGLLGLITVFYVGYRFIRELGKSLPILELMLLVAGLQWIVGPLIEYSFPTLHYKYYMYVEEPVYMGYVAPAYFVFSAVLLIGLRKKWKYFIPLEDLGFYSRYGIFLFLVGLGYDLLSGYLGFLGFLGYIISNLKFVGAIILFFSPKLSLRRIFYLMILFLFYRSLTTALFHEFILWSAFFFIFWAYQYKPSIKIILTTFLLAGFFLLTLQSVKAAYRSQVWSGYAGNKVELFFTLFLESLVSEPIENEDLDTEVSNNVRLNQGWIISAIMYHVPNEQEFFEGETIIDAIRSSFVPRFLDPNKTLAGGRENFLRFTGLDLGEGTSMGISIVGEGYGNFGVEGGILFMFAWALFLLWVWKFILRKVYHNVLLTAFIPLIFFQVVKAETELVVVLNHLVKTLIFVLVFIYMTRKFWAFKLIYAD